MSLAGLSRFCPAVGQQLFEFACLHRVDPGEDISEVFDRVDVVGFAGSHEGKVDCRRSASGIRTDKETVLPHQNEVLDRSLGRVVVDIEIGVLQESRQGDPVVEGVVDGRREHMCRIECSFERENLCVQFFHQWLGAGTPGSQPFRRCFSCDVPFHSVELFVYIQNDVARFGLNGQTIVILSSRVGMTADLRSRTVLEEGIKTTGGIRLNAGVNIFEPCFISVERLVRRKIENQELEGASHVDGHLAFTHSTFDGAILDFDFGVVGIDHVRLANLASHHLVQKLESQCGIKRTVTLGRTGNQRILSFEPFFLSIVRQACVWQIKCSPRGNRKWGHPSKSMAA